METFTRRTFINRAMSCGLALYGISVAGCKGRPPRLSIANARTQHIHDLTPGVFAARGAGDPARLTRAAVNAAGGMEKLVRRGDVVVIKPNMAWDRRPEQAANTNPIVVATLARLALESGAGEVRVFDRGCHSPERCYKTSGIAEAAEKAGASVRIPDESRFVPVGIRGARMLKECLVYKDALEADVLINVPILKHHGAVGLTLGMKNLMGCVGGDRSEWHFDHIDQRIADLQLALKPDLVVIDAVRVLTRNGPVGGSVDYVTEMNTVAVSTDIVAADSYAARLFGCKPEEIGAIRIAAEMGIGSADDSAVPVREFSIS